MVNFPKIGTKSSSLEGNFFWQLGNFFWRLQLCALKFGQLLFQDSGKTMHGAEKNDTSYKRAGFFTEMKQKKNQNGRIKKNSFSSSTNSEYFFHEIFMDGPLVSRIN